MGEHVKEAAAPRRYRVTFLSVIGELLITIAPASTHRTEPWVSAIPTTRRSSP